MKSKMLMLAGVAGMLMASPAPNAFADVNISVGGAHPHPSFVINRPPTFVRLATPGFSIAIGNSPYDIVLYGNFYYLYNQGQWYRSPRYNGPWTSIRERALPPKIRRYRIEQIRRFRDAENNRRRDRRDDRRDQRRDDRRDDRRPGSTMNGHGHNDGRPMHQR